MSLLPADPKRFAAYGAILNGRAQAVIPCRDCGAEESLIITRQNDQLITMFCEECGPKRGRRYIHDPNGNLSPAAKRPVRPYSPLSSPPDDPALRDDPLMSDPQFQQAAREYRARKWGAEE